MAGIHAAQAYRSAACGQGLAGYCRHELLLTVARYTGNADDFAAAHAEVDRAQGRAEGILALQRQIGEREPDFPGFAREQSAFLEFTADHEPRQTRVRFIAGNRRTADSAVAQYRRYVAEFA